jgi:RimJ/RimL family protein N-acetyltransferase
MMKVEARTMTEVLLRAYRDSDQADAFRIRELVDAEQQEKFAKRMATSGEWDEHYLHLAVEHEGVLVGDVQLRRCASTVPDGALEIGIDIDPVRRGLGLGTAALRAATERMFAEGAHRIAGSTAGDNLAMRRAFLKAGWGFEGVLKALFLEDGQPIDYYSYAITKFMQNPEQTFNQ